MLRQPLQELYGYPGSACKRSRPGTAGGTGGGVWSGLPQGHEAGTG